MSLRRVRTASRVVVRSSVVSLRERLPVRRSAAALAATLAVDRGIVWGGLLRCCENLFFRQVMREQVLSFRRFGFDEFDRMKQISGKHANIYQLCFSKPKPIRLGQVWNMANTEEEMPGATLRTVVKSAWITVDSRVAFIQLGRARWKH